MSDMSKIIKSCCSGYNDSFGAFTNTLIVPSYWNIVPLFVWYVYCILVYAILDKIPVLDGETDRISNID